MGSAVVTLGRMEDDNKPKVLKVRELITMLQTIVAADPAVAEYNVKSDGCDCTGDAVDIEVNPGGFYPPHVLVCRK